MNGNMLRNILGILGTCWEQQKFNTTQPFKKEKKAGVSGACRNSSLVEQFF
jgi:hypothetical protein